MLLPHQSGRAVLDRNLMAPHEIRRHIGLNGMQPHQFLDGVIEGEVDKIHLHDPRESMGEIVKQLIKVTLCGNCLRDLQERLVALREILTGRNALPIHSPAVWTIYRQWLKSSRQTSESVSMTLSTSSERLVRPVTERRSLCMFALAQRDVFLCIHGELNRFKPGPFV